MQDKKINLRLTVTTIIVSCAIFIGDAVAQNEPSCVTDSYRHEGTVGSYSWDARPEEWSIYDREHPNLSAEYPWKDIHLVIGNKSGILISIPPSIVNVSVARFELDSDQLSCAGFNSGDEIWLFKCGGRSNASLDEAIIAKFRNARNARLILLDIKGKILRNRLLGDAKASFFRDAISKAAEEHVLIAKRRRCPPSPADDKASCSGFLCLE